MEGPYSTISTPTLRRGTSPQERSQVVLLPWKRWGPLRHYRAGRRLLLCRLGPRGLSARRGDQQEGLQGLRSEISGGIRRHRCHAGSRCCHLLCFRNAEALGVSTDTYSLWGSSAGARMVATIGTYGVAAYGRDDLPKPAAIVMAYTAHSDHSSAEPPTFVVVGENDGIAPPATMERRVAALRQAGVEVEYHKYKGLGHGFGLGSGTNAEGWSSMPFGSGKSSSGQSANSFALRRFGMFGR